MGVLLLLGCLLIGYSVPAALFFLLFLRKAQLVIVMLASAFFWLLSLTLSSLIWSAIPPLQDSSYGWAIVPVGVVVQECARFLFVRLYAKSERSFAVVSINAIVFPLVDLWSAVAAGVGFGAAQSFVFFAPILAHSLGRGALWNAHCSAFSTFVSGAWTALLFNVLQPCLMILAFDAFRAQSPGRYSVVLGLHAAAAGFTVLNNVDGGCTKSLPLVAAVVIVALAWTAVIIHRVDYRSSKQRIVYQAIPGGQEQQ